MSETEGREWGNKKPPARFGCNLQRMHTDGRQKYSPVVPLDAVQLPFV